MKYLLVIIPLFFISCVNKRGISLRYYPECHEYYDYYGVYKEKCEHNIINWNVKEKTICLDCN